MKPSMEKEKYFAGTVKNSLEPLLYLRKDSEDDRRVIKGKVVQMSIKSMFIHFECSLSLVLHSTWTCETHQTPHTLLQYTYIHT